MENELKEIVKDNEKFYAVVNKLISGNHPKVYFIRCHDYVKIGTCRSDFQLRFSELQIGCPYTLEFEFLIPGGHDLEQSIHKELKEYKHRGEWYKLSKEEVQHIWKKVIKNYER